MRPGFTYLISHAGSEELFGVCKDAIQKYTPGDSLVVTLAMYRYWEESFAWLFNNCPTNVGVFIDDDCILRDNIGEYIEAVSSGDAYAAAIDGESLGRGKGYYQPNLMILDIKRFTDEFGKDGWRTDRDMYKKDTGKDTNDIFLGISQKLKDKRVIPFLAEKSEWPLADDIFVDHHRIATHLWYGAWRHRGHKFVDGIDLEKREKDFINSIQ